MRIMMGQNRQTPDILTERKEQDRHAAGYVDEPKNESYLPSSVHDSPRHMTTLARNALILVSEFGCPHVFITFTCNPKWPEICSQLYMDKLLLIVQTQRAQCLSHVFIR